MNFDVVNQVLILFIVIFIGIIARKKNYLSKEVNKGLSEILVNITLPLLVISSFTFKYSEDMLINIGKVFIFSMLINLILVFLSKIIFSKFPQNERNILKFVTVFSNCGFMGFPVLQSLYGKTAVFYGSIFNITFNLFMFTYGIMLFTNKKDIMAFKRILINPVIICTGIGLLIFRFSIILPIPIDRAINMVGSMTTPISMLIIGAMLADINIKEAVLGYKVYLVSFLRLIIAPLITLFILKLLGAEGLILKVLVVIQAMPAAATAAVFTEKYGGNESLTSRCILMTTAFSIITIPLIIQLLN
ncbi:MAG: AEC family transporter [Clostridiaceae bacterium]|nr:AEC family transporter [Clostridiaceae bacterium]